MPKIRVTLTLIPLAIDSVIAGRPSSVAGILINALSRWTVSHRVRASAIVRSVSRASLGETSIDTLPSRGSVWWTGASTSQALRTSSVVSSKIALSTSPPSAFTLRSWSS